MTCAWRWLRRTAGRANHRLGFRGRSLLFVAYLALVFMALLASPPPGATATLGLLPLPVWAAMWAATGVACLVGAFAQRDAWAYGAAICMVTLWATMYLASWWPAGINPRGWLAGLVYLPFAAFLLNNARWPEPVEPISDLLEPGYPTAVVTADARGIITGWHGSAAEIFGWHAAEIIGQSLSVLMPQRYRAAHEAAVAGLDRTGQTRSGRTLYVSGLHRDGHEIALSIYVQVENTGDGHTLYAAVRLSPSYGPPWPGEVIPP